MIERAQIIRGANFAYPYSERGDYYTPKTVRLLIAISFCIVVMLVMLPFLLRYLESSVYARRGGVTAEANTMRLQFEEAAPVLNQKAFLDSVKADIDARVNLRSTIEAADYRADRLLLHISELVPDGIVLTSINMQPPDRRTTGRLGTVSQTEELPEELKDTFLLNLEGTARNSNALTGFMRALDQSPIFYRPTQRITPLENSLVFRVSCRLPGSGVSVEGGGS